MNILVISFSGRKGAGNCSKISDFIQEHLHGHSVNVSSIRMADLDIESCTDCNYECFDSLQKCPKVDDLNAVYERIMESDATIMIIPVYSAAPPALYFAWRERSQSIFLTEEICQKFDRVKKAFIIIGNKDAGADGAVTIIEKYHANAEKDIGILLLQSREYGQKSVEGRLINVHQVQMQLKRFLNMFITG